MGSANLWESRIGDHAGIDANMALSGPEMAGFVGRNGIDLSLLRRRVSRNPPPTTTEISADGIVVSTIHRSKGLEFDDVLLLEPRGGGIKDPEEVRVLYVAATRARKTLSILTRAKKVFRGGNRLPQGHFAFDGRSSLLVSGLDEVDTESVIDPFPDDRHQPLRERLERVQESVWRQVMGSSVPQAFDVLARKRDRWHDFYLSVPESGGDLELAICTLSPGLSRDLWTLLSSRGLPTSGFVGRVPVPRLATIAFDEMDAESTELLGASGMALVPVIEGPLNIVGNTEDARHS